MSDITPYVGGGLTAREARRTGREISRYHAGGRVRMTKIDTETDIAVEKVDAVTAATGTAMGSVVRVAQAQRHLEQLAPEAAARLAFLADDHMLAVGDMVHDLRRELRKR